MTDENVHAVDAVVFDIGETLVDETRLWCAWADWLEVPRLTLLALIGAGIVRDVQPRDVLRELRPGIDLAAERRRRRDLGDPDRFVSADLYPDVEPALRELHAAGYALGIAGNQPAGWEDFLTELPVPFALCASSGTWRLHKPDPQFFTRICDTLGLPAHRVAYVGDRVDNDVLPARAAGMVSVHLRRGPWGRLHALRPEAARATLRIDALSELPAALRLMPRAGDHAAG
jgi:HAD superfamily hydrolase (TIGR01549 family)